MCCGVDRHLVFGGEPTVGMVFWELILGLRLYFLNSQFSGVFRNSQNWKRPASRVRIRLSRFIGTKDKASRVLHFIPCPLTITTTSWRKRKNVILQPWDDEYDYCDRTEGCRGRWPTGGFNFFTCLLERWWIPRSWQLGQQCTCLLLHFFCDAIPLLLSHRFVSTK